MRQARVCQRTDVSLSKNNNHRIFGASPKSAQMEPMHAMKAAAALFGMGAVEGVSAHALTPVVSTELLLIVVIRV